MAYMEGQEGWHAVRESDAVVLVGPDGEGAHVPLDVFDSLVLMRSAQLADDLELPYKVGHTLEVYGGHFGCDALRVATGLKSNMQQIIDDVTGDEPSSTG